MVQADIVYSWHWRIHDSHVEMYIKRCSLVQTKGSLLKLTCAWYVTHFLRSDKWYGQERPQIWVVLAGDGFGIHGIKVFMSSDLST